MLVMLFWGEIMSSDQKPVTNSTPILANKTKESTDTLKMLEDNIGNGEKSTLLAINIKKGPNATAENSDEEKTARNINRSNSTYSSENRSNSSYSSENIIKSNSTYSSENKKFQPMLSVFLIELILVLLSNLFTLMIRSYKNSIPLVKLNIIILISFYLVELGNFVLICQVG